MLSVGIFLAVTIIFAFPIYVILMIKRRATFSFYRVDTVVNHSLKLSKKAEQTTWLYINNKRLPETFQLAFLLRLVMRFRAYLHLH